MSLCPKDQKLVIEFRYPRETKQKIVGADDYSVVKAPPPFEGGQCEIPYWCTAEVGGKTAVGVKITGKVVDIICYMHSAGHWSRRAHTISAVNDKGEVKTNTQVNFIKSDNYEYFATPYYDHQDTCGDMPTDCFFSVFKNDEVVFSRVEYDCPKVEHYCVKEECPPGTCECVKGKTVCCYNIKTGIAIKEFIRD